MAYTEAGKKATMKYIKGNYDRLEIKIPKGRKTAVEAAAKERGESINSLVNGFLREVTGLSEPDWKRTEADEGAEANA